MAKPGNESDYCRYDLKGVTVFIQAALFDEYDGELCFSMMKKGPFILTYHCEITDVNNADS
jgi:hypothetical protein